MRRMSTRKRRELSARPRSWFRDCQTSRHFSADLINDTRQVRDFETMPGQFSQRCDHQPRLQTHMAVAHLAVLVRLGHSAATESQTKTSLPRGHQRFGNFMPARRNPAAKPADYPHPRPASWRSRDRARVRRHESGHSPGRLRLRDHLQRPMVVLPEDSGPKIQPRRPRGKPPTPSAASNESRPSRSPKSERLPLSTPNPHNGALAKLFSICANAGQSPGSARPP